jgi:hypothetical protein
VASGLTSDEAIKRLGEADVLGEIIEVAKEKAT